MAGTVRYLLNRDGRYFARLVVPPKLRPFIGGKSELRTALGPDRKEAIKRLNGAVALLQHEIALAERRAAEAGQRPIAPGRYPLTIDQLALRNYQSRIAFDEELRRTDHRYALIGSVDDGYAARFKEGIAGRLSDAELHELVGARIERFRRLGNTTAEFGTSEWRSLAWAMCVSEYEALSRVAERDDGDFTGTPTYPLIANAVAPPDETPPVSLRTLLADYIAARKLVGKGTEADRRWGPVFRNLRKAIGHEDARRLTKQNLLNWRDELLKTLAPKTVADVYLAAVRTVLSWAVANDRLDANVADQVRQDVPKQKLNREQGYTLAEATAVLKASRAYVPAEQDNPANREAIHTTSAKQWAPLLCAFSGARITEITQLRKKDCRIDDGLAVIRITPDAGTVKAGGYRDVPLHPQILDLGFLDFVKSSEDGPLFYATREGGSSLSKARTVSGRISQWLQRLEVVPEGVSPSHGWRHRFKTIGQELEISDRILDAIQGHAGKTAGDSYGDVTLKAKHKAILKYPYYEI
ncbi:hypothetical protein [Bosea sp. TND4EK4]|uniref:hypothetical protein n=1 Tax=Bosea sp. TND4EK4 TaxID=1907408 RepID=UPI000954D42A|nr:hypothetical protein [Bosea sp. TND4EK4]SIQ11853.1 Site-specific recombinase XerD [Bosea sp. TND4EK4]